MGIVKKLNNELNHISGILYASDSKQFYGKSVAEVKIDEEDYEKCKKYGWYINKKGYVFTLINNKTILLHRFIMGIDDTETTVDHDDGDKLNNTKINLLTMSNTDNLLKSWYQQRQREHMKKSVVMIDKNTDEELLVFESTKQAAIYLQTNNKSKGFLQGAISNACNKVRKSAGGYKWRWLR